MSGIWGKLLPVLFMGIRSSNAFSRLMLTSSVCRGSIRPDQHLDSTLGARAHQEKANDHNIMEKSPSIGRHPIAVPPPTGCSSEIVRKFAQVGASERHLVFVYGTLKRNEPNYDIMQNTVYRGVAKTVDRWPMVIASRYNIPFLLYCKGKGEQVVGELYEVDDHMLKTLDEFECHPNYYTRLRVEVVPSTPDTEQSLLTPPPWTYFLCSYKEELLQLPYLSDYSSDGPHGLPYVESESTCDPEDIYK